MGTRYDINDVVLYEGNKKYLVKDIIDPDSESPTYILKDSARGTRRAKASQLKKEGSEPKFADSKFQIGDLVEVKEPTMNIDGQGKVRDIEEHEGFGSYTYVVDFPSGRERLGGIDLEYAGRGR